MNYKEMNAALENEFGAEWKYALQNSSITQELSFIRWAENEGHATDYYYKDCMARVRREMGFMLNPCNVHVGDGVTVRLYSDAYAATVTKVTACSVTCQRDKATLDPNFKPEWVPGGFAGHCLNQDEQSYTYERDPSGDLYTFRWSNKYGSYGQPGNLRLTKGRREFYDYNF